jgi:hypothetical protein
MAKINLTKAKALVDELGVVEEYSREIDAEVKARKKALWPYVGQTLTTDEFQSSIFEREGRTLDVAKVMRKFKLTEKQLASCYRKQEKSVVVSIKRIDVTKKAQNKDFIKQAKRKIQ